MKRDIEMNIEKVNHHILGKNDNGYAIVLENDNVKRSMDIISESDEDLFFASLEEGQPVYLILIDSKIVGLCENLDNFILVRDFVFAHGKTRLVNDNIRYLERVYELDEEKLENMIREELMEVIVNENFFIKSAIIKDIVNLIKRAILVVDVDGKCKNIGILNGTEEAKLLVEMCQDDTICSWNEIKDCIVGDKLLLVYFDDVLVSLVSPRIKKTVFIKDLVAQDAMWFDPDGVEYAIQRKGFELNPEVKEVIAKKLERKSV